MAKTAKKTTKKKAAKVSILENTNYVNALSYVPYFIGAVAMFFLGKSDKKSAMHHIIRSAILAAVAIVATILLTGSFLGIFVTPLYIVGSVFLAWKAYNGEEVKVEILDTIEDTITQKIKK